MKNHLIITCLVFCIGLISCIKTENQSQDQNQNQEEKEYEIKDIDKINEFLNSCKKIYSFKSVEFTKSDEAFSPPKQEIFKYKNIYLKINSETIKIYDSNMILIKSFRITQKNIKYTESLGDYHYSIVLKHEHSTDRQDNIFIFSEKSYEEIPKINGALIEYHLKGLKYSWDFDNILNPQN